MALQPSLIEVTFESFHTQSNGNITDATVEIRT